MHIWGARASRAPYYGPLVGGIGVGVEEADGDRFHACGHDGLAHLLLHRLLIQRKNLLPGVAQPLRHLVTVPPLHQRVGLRQVRS